MDDESAPAPAPIQPGPSNDADSDDAGARRDWRTGILVRHRAGGGALEDVLAHDVVSAVVVLVAA